MCIHVAVVIFYYVHPPLQLRFRLSCPFEQIQLSNKKLQIILNKLESFCENADLSVNLDKTKIMINYEVI